MHRRGFLTRVSAGVVGMIGYGHVRPPGRTAPPPTADGRVQSVAGTPLPVPEEALANARPQDYIPAITDPTFDTDWSGLSISVYNNLNQLEEIEPRLTAEDPVIGLVRGGEARAYPFRVLNWHEVVNDYFGGPLLVTYCPLCASGMTAERVIDGQSTVFGVSGKLWNSDLVMYDQSTGSLWSQIAATAIRGPMTGIQLSLVPSSTTTWGAWQADHPDTRVLIPPPISGTIRERGARNYRLDNPYLVYDSIPAVGIGQNEVPEHDSDLDLKATVLGVRARGTAKAYPLETIRAKTVINDAVGDVPVVVAIAGDGETIVAYVRRVGDTTASFEPAGDGAIRGAGSRWSITTGRATSGPHRGMRLPTPARTARLFWFAWLDFNPETTVYVP